MDKIKKIIDRLDLKPHVEGGFYKQTYKSNESMQLNNNIRSINTAIYYLLESHDFSCWHRLKSDEMWHYYCGSKLIIYKINEKGVLSSTIIGNLLEDDEALPQCLIPAGTWFAAQVLSPHSFTLVGCTVAPGFEYEDFEIGNKKNLLEKYSQHTSIIMKFMREID